MRRMLGQIVENRMLFLFLLLLILFIVFSLGVPGFFTFYNLTNMTQYGVELGLLALAEMLVILSGGGGIDLSVGSMLTLVAMVIGVLIGRVGFNPSLSILLGLLAGVGMGYVNGVLVSYLRILPLIVTLASLYIYKSLALIVAVDPRFGPNPMPVSNFPETFYFVGQFRVGGIPFQVLFIFIPVILILWFLLEKHAFGRYLYGVGSNETAALFSGIDVRRVRLTVYTLAGLLAALSGWIITSRIASARPDIGLGYEMQAITIAVLGGVNIKGGEGTIGGVIMGVAIITLLYNGMQLAGIHQIWQLGSLGLVLVGSVFLNQALLARRKF
jgi:ribose/xylose/arabinose/galactoside ABC-type transport system permease subunit